MRDKARRITTTTPALPPRLIPDHHAHADHGQLHQPGVAVPAMRIQAHTIAALQQTVGNQVTQRLLARKNAAALLSTHGAPVTRRARSASIVQRTLWEANDALAWVARAATGDEIEPEQQPTQAGQLFDDQTNRWYASQEEYDNSRFTDAVMGDSDLPEDDLDDSEFKYVDEAESSDDEETGVDADTLPIASDDQEMTLEARKEQEQRGLKRPRETSTLTPPVVNRPRKTFTSNAKLKRKGKTTIEQRSSASGSVTITLETVELWVNDKKSEYVRPVEIVGMVEPTATTGRGRAPDPLSGTQIYMGKQGQLKESIPSERNMGMPDTERGHIMALELGGPDIPENIVPQWAKFQGSGEWRRMEVAVLETAKQLPKGQLLKYHVSVSYKETGTITPTIRNFGIPSHFRATTQVCDTKWNALGAEVEVFNQAQAQDITDNMLAEREMSKLDGADWDPELDLGEPKKKRARTTKPSKTPAKKNQPDKKRSRKKGGQ